MRDLAHPQPAWIRDRASQWPGARNRRRGAYNIPTRTARGLMLRFWRSEVAAAALSLSMDASSPCGRIPAPDSPPVFNLHRQQTHHDVASASVMFYRARLVYVCILTLTPPTSYFRESPSSGLFIKVTRGCSPSRVGLSHPRGPREMPWYAVKSTPSLGAVPRSCSPKQTNFLRL